MCNECIVSPHLSKLERASAAFKAEGDALYAKAKEAEDRGEHPARVKGLRAAANEWFAPARAMRLEAHHIRMSITKKEINDARIREGLRPIEQVHGHR